MHAISPPPQNRARAPFKSRNHSRFGLFRFSVAQFLGALVLMFGAFPFLEELPRGDIIASFLMTLVLLSATLAVGSGRTFLVIAFVLVVIPIAGQWMDYVAPGLVPMSVNIMGGVTFVL